MPIAAAGGGVDFVLTPMRIAKQLEQIALGLNSKQSTDVIHSNDFQAILKLLTLSKNIDFLQYKMPTVYRRIVKRMQMRRINEVKKYFEYLCANVEEVEHLYEDILIKVIEFFRNVETFDTLKKTIIPKILNADLHRDSVRVWVPGCSTGEEVYSIAICFFEAMEEANLAFRVEIFATDISDKALTRARAGFYDETRMHNLSAERVERFFVRDGNGYRVSHIIRDFCIFAKQNVARDPPFSRMDLISCRNLLIYFSPGLQECVLAGFHFGLKPEGFLALGSAETVGTSASLFNVVDKHAKIYSKKPGFKTATIAEYPRELKGDKKTVFISSHDPHNDVGSKFDIKSEADRAILSQFAPAGVIIDERMEVLQFRGDTSPFLMHPAGDVTTNLFKMCRDGLVVDLRTAIQQASGGVETVRTPGRVRFTNKEPLPITIDVIPFKLPNTSQSHFIVLFSTNIQKNSRSMVMSPEEIIECRRLEQELSTTKDYLNAIIDREQAANEELKSASEEILSANEELQSTNEEMATAKEEVQATNEELLTVNDELQSRFQELNRVNSDLTNLFEATNTPIVMISDKLVIRRFTPAARTVLNITDDDVGKTLNEVGQKLRFIDIERLAADVIQSLNTKEVDIQDNKGRWFSLKIKPYRTRDNRIDGAVIVLRDISHEKEIEGRTNQAKNAAEASNLAKSDFLANMSHEIRTPLSAILGYSELLSNLNQTGSDTSHCITRIQRNIEHLTELVDEILDLSKIEAGKLDIERIWFSLLPELGDIFSLLRERATSKCLYLNLNFEGGIPEKIFSCPMRLRQILLNTVGNALKFTAKGGVNISISLANMFPASNAGKLIFEIKDSGCGLSLDQQDRIFRPFSQADGSVTRNYGGTGLGLVLSRRLARALGGDVELTHSETNKGSTFTFYLDPGPLDDIKILKSVRPADLSAFKNEPDDFFVVSKKLAGIAILLVEDGPDNQILMTHILEASGATVESAFNGAEAVKMAKANDYDLVLMDMQMPILDGYEATKQLTNGGYQVPIIALTANAMRGERETCLAAGCIEYVSKPIKANLLVDTVARLARKK